VTRYSHGKLPAALTICAISIVAAILTNLIHEGNSEVTPGQSWRNIAIFGGMIVAFSGRFHLSFHPSLDAVLN
jgi:hypothetical protein